MHILFFLFNREFLILYIWHFFRDYLVVMHFLLEYGAYRCNQHLEACGAPLCHKEGVHLGYLIKVLPNFSIL